MEKVEIAATRLHVVSDDEARGLFNELLGRGDAWASELMQYRTSSDWQDDWVVEVGNWLAHARALGFLDQVLGQVVPQRAAQGSRDAGDPVHRNVTQRLAQAMAVHYFVGTGWRLEQFEPRVTDMRGDGAKADVDLQMAPPSTSQIVVDMQVKASGTLGLRDHEVDPQIIEGVRKAAAQLPDPPLGPALIVIAPQRAWPIYADTQVLEQLIGSTCGYGSGRVLLHDDAHGELKAWTHVSGIVTLDHLRGSSDSDYGCSVLQNPWAAYSLDPRWFPHARVLTYDSGEFIWRNDEPITTTFPSGTRLARGPSGSALDDRDLE